MRSRSFAGLCVVAIAAAIPSAPVTVQASAPPGTTCQVFPPDNIWNTDISSLPVHPRSAAWLSSTGATSGRLLHPDFGGPPYGIPYNVVDNSHATANFNFLYWDESDPIVASQQPQGPYPYGSDLVVEAPSDSHLLTINKDTCTLYETSGTDYNGPHTGWSGAVFPLGSNSLRPDTWTSADAAGLPIFPGLVRLDEVQAGAINHAIRFTVQQSDTTHLWPARHDAGSASNHNLPPMGARFRLKAGFNTSGFNAQAQVVLDAMKHYGLIVADNGSNWYFQGTMDAGWDSEPYATMVSQLKTVPASAFEAVDESSLMISASSGQARTPCVFGGLTASKSSPQALGTAVTFTASAGGCAVTPEYEFWVYGNGVWKLVQPYSSSNTWNLDYSKLPTYGTYTVDVWIRNSGSAASLQTYGLMSWVVGGCNYASTTNTSGTVYTTTAGGVACTNPEYKVWMIGNGRPWWVASDWSAANTFDASTVTGLSAGSYSVDVWVRQHGASSNTGYFETWGLATYITGGACSTDKPTLGAAPGSPASTGSGSVIFTAIGCGPGAQYEYWIYPGAKGGWQLLRSYSGTASYTWNPSLLGLKAGNYSIDVWAKQAGSTSTSYESYGLYSYELNGCTSAAMTQDKVNPQTNGATITFTTAAPACSNPEYSYWVLPKGGSWTNPRPYSTVPSFAWTPGAVGTYSIVVHVRQHNGGTPSNSLETFDETSLTITP